MGFILAALCVIAFIGLVAVFVAAIVYVVFALAFGLAMIPIAIIFGSESAGNIMDTVLNFRVIYAIVFVLLMCSCLSNDE